MKKLLLGLITIFSIYCVQAQESRNGTAEAMQLIKTHKTAIGLSDIDIQNSFISDTYVSAEGIRMVYLQQTWQGVPVFNQIQVLAFKDGKLMSNAGGRIRNIEKRITSPSASAFVSATDAVSKVITECKLKPLQDVQVTKENGRKLEFGKMDISEENIFSELTWYPVNEQEYRLAWQVFISPINADDMWLMEVDAANGNIAGKINLTVYDKWHDEKNTHNNNITVASTNYVGERQQQSAFSPKYFTPAVNSASYRVVPYPAESPTHPGGTPAVVTDPWLLAPGNATTLKWHNDGTTDHDSTRGNNVWAAEDRNNTNSVIDKAAVSTTPQPNLTFDFVPDFAQSPILTSPPNQQFNITNLFYWNNIIHDITYLYGFDEVSGNFQNDNMGRGGAGGDYVIGDAQDGGGTNNANFATPADGSRPRMQMYIWTPTNPDRDGDADNSIIVHEFGHGISNRLTGGPNQSGCVSNGEHGGEGWSDYFGLMLTTNWATATINDGFNIPRGIGTYVLGQAPTGNGIRNFRYCTNMAINPLVYSATLPSQVHNRGEYLCMALWEMTWEMIQQGGINPNLYNSAAAGGNSAALKLVIEGMKLQPCGPGFIDVRDAILEADTMFFGGLYSCSIWRAFAKRGMGRNASQGSANSVTDQIPDFTVDNGIFSITQSAPQIVEGQNVTYTNHITAGVCSPMNNFFITDTLPTNVTYVSGGTYNAGNRTITFGPINLSTNQSATYPFTVTVNTGTYFTPVTHFDEQVTGTSIPAAWTISPASGNTWSVSTTSGNSAPNSFFAPDLGVLTDMRLENSSSYSLNATVSSYTTLSFWHRFNTEDGWDGGVVEISTNNGSTWSDLGPKMTIGKYNGSLGSGSGNPIANRQAFTGNSGAGFMQTVINLASYAGQSVRIRFRFASDDNTAPAGGGWWVDDIVLHTQPAVVMKSNLFNNSNQLVSVTDTITQITQGAPPCNMVVVNTQPSSVSSCDGNSTSFMVDVSGTSPMYQWQVNTGSGFTNLANTAPYSGVNTATLSLTGITTGMDGYQYRCVLSNACTAPLNSSVATLTVGANASITTQPVASTVCEGVSTSFSIAATGSLSYQWQVNSGSGFVDVANNTTYSGATTTTLNIANPAASLSGNQYRCVVGSCAGALNSNAVTLTISVPVAITAQPVNTSACEGTNTGFTIGLTGTASSIQWQISTNGGTSYTDISGANTATYNISSVPAGMNGYMFRCVIAGACGLLTSNAITLTVNRYPTFNLSGLNQATICVSDPVLTLNAPLTGGSWSGSGVSGSIFNPAAAGIGTATLTYSVTNAGCTTAQSISMAVNECAERHVPLDKYPALVIYPNPSTGKFQIKVNTDLYSRLGVNVYNSRGQLMQTRQFSGIGYGSILPMDISALASGGYHLYIYNDESDFISKGLSIVLYH
ncbi:MAG: M36 family metallopeptidase [Chitinophagales bacterium]|nr:M36 family metallopeptidase [Chitinophagales bacterium]